MIPPVLDDERALCASCRQHLRGAAEAAAACRGASAGRECYERMYREFHGLRGAAAGMNSMIIEKYARHMMALARFLHDKPGRPAASEQALLGEAIAFGVRCAGADRDKCPQMNYDQLLPLIDRINRLTGD